MPLTSPRSHDETRAFNAAYLEKLASDDAVQVKEAKDATNDFVRFKLRESSYFELVMPAIPLGYDKIDKDLNTAKPIKYFDLEPDTFGAKSIPFGNLPDEAPIMANRAKVTFERIVTKKRSADIAELAGYEIDIRQVISDNDVRDMHTEMDTKGTRAWRSIVGAANSVVPAAGSALHQTLPGGLSRDSLEDMMKILPSTKSKLGAKTALINHISIHDVAKFDRSEMGGDLSQDVFRDGIAKLKGLMGLEWIVTIKTELVDNLEIFTFPDASFMGRHWELDPVTMYLKREAFLLEFFSYRLNGATIGNINTVGLADFT